MPFPRIESALALCDAQLATPIDDPAKAVELESLLVSAAVVMIVSELEGCVVQAFETRGRQCQDEHVASFVTSNVSRRFWSPGISKINDALGEFGVDYRERFKARVENTKLHASWDNVLRARQEVVHKRGTPSLTLRELRTAFEDCKGVLSALDETLGISQNHSETPDTTA